MDYPHLSRNFEILPMVQYEFGDLNQDALEAYLTQRVPQLLVQKGLEETAMRLGFAVHKGKLVPTALGLILFGAFPQLTLPHWGIAAMKFEGKTISDPIAFKEDLEGNFFVLLEKSLAFIDKHMGHLTDAIHPHQVQDEYPMEAVREALINALIHRDWAMPARISIRLFKNRLEIWNPGKPLLNLQELLEHGGYSYSRNVLLSATVRLLGIGEQIGRGLPMIRHWMSQWSSLPLSIQAGKHDVCVILPSAFDVSHQAIS